MNKAYVVIIGGGVVGCSIAYNLAKKGVKDIIVLERKYLSYGATGRCGAGIRQQWGTHQNCILSTESIKIFENMNELLQTKRDIELKQKGYLLLAYSEKELNQFKKNIKVQHEHNIPSTLVTPEEAKEVVPMLNTKNIIGGAFCPTDGHANPFLVNQAYADAAKRLGVKFIKAEAVGIKKKEDKIIGVETNQGFIETMRVVNAAGAWSKEIGSMVNIDLPVYSEVHEILATEPVKPILNPMVMSFSHNFYCQQTPHGSFIMGMSPVERVKDVSWQFLERMTKKISTLLPPTKNLRVVRQWSGYYNISPDKQPIVCESEEVEGFYMAIGFSGHGFMLSPAVGILMSNIILKERLQWDVTLDIGRFKRNEIIEEPSVV